MVFHSRPFCPKSSFKIPICLKTTSRSGNGATHPRVSLGQDRRFLAYYWFRFSFGLEIGLPKVFGKKCFCLPKVFLFSKNWNPLSLHLWHVLIEQDPLRILRWCWNFKFLQHVALHGIGRLFLNSFWWKFLLLSPLLLFLCLWFSPHHQVALCLQTDSGLSEHCWCS